MAWGSCISRGGVRAGVLVSLEFWAGRASWQMTRRMPETFPGSLGNPLLTFLNKGPVFSFLCMFHNPRTALGEFQAFNKNCLSLIERFAAF